jgi:hypothetical protein
VPKYRLLHVVSVGIYKGFIEKVRLFIKIAVAVRASSAVCSIVISTDVKR